MKVKIESTPELVSFLETFATVEQTDEGVDFTLNMTLSKKSDEGFFTLKGINDGEYLYLDDVRNPMQSAEFTKQDIYLTKMWRIVRNFTEFQQYFKKYGMPKFISFDHDLGVESGCNGFDCALWLTDYCMNNKLTLPEYYVHSMNPVGRDNIIGLLESFKKYQKENA